MRIQFICVHSLMRITINAEYSTVATFFEINHALETDLVFKLNSFNCPLQILRLLFRYLENRPVKLLHRSRFFHLSISVEFPPFVIMHFSVEYSHFKSYYGVSHSLVSAYSYFQNYLIIFQK